MDQLIEDSLDYWAAALDTPSWIRLMLSLSWQRVAWREQGEQELVLD